MNVLQSLARLAAPPACVGCGRESALLCERCMLEFIQQPPAACFWCGRSSQHGRTCWLCTQVTALVGVKVAGCYGGSVRELVHRLKYRRQREAAATLAAAITPLLTGMRVDAVTAVPGATTRLRRRSYNQSELIARAVARELAVPYSRLLHRRRNTQQVGRRRDERISQVCSLFVATKPPPASVLVVDDVLTTGATLNACATALRAAGATEIWGAAAARD